VRHNSLLELRSLTLLSLRAGGPSDGA